MNFFYFLFYIKNGLYTSIFHTQYIFVYIFFITLFKFCKSVQGDVHKS
jgi:hypothetical protein